jgi:hypothetical protein
MLTQTLKQTFYFSNLVHFRKTSTHPKKHPKQQHFYSLQKHTDNQVELQ